MLPKQAGSNLQGENGPCEKTLVFDILFVNLILADKRTDAAGVFRLDSNTTAS